MIIDSPVGRLLIEATQRGLSRVEFLESTARPHLSPLAEGEGDAALTLEAARQLSEYFAGARREFQLALDIAGSDFQRRVWRGIAAIPYGSTLSYADLAALAGFPGAARAAGAACGANPVAVVVPCHRVVGADGSLHGFGGGLPTKAWLLDHEQAWLGTKLPPRPLSKAKQASLLPV
jgi:methylated-DNA-[protein]-cysteine S-methyltransferase